MELPDGKAYFSNKYFGILSYGADIFFRKKMEDYLAKSDEHSYTSRRVPIVCVAIEGGHWIGNFKSH